MSDLLPIGVANSLLEVHDGSQYYMYSYIYVGSIISALNGVVAGHTRFLSVFFTVADMLLNSDATCVCWNGSGKVVTGCRISLQYRVVARLTSCLCLLKIYLELLQVTVGILYSFDFL
jgi:hypothetical protein